MPISEVDHVSRGRLWTGKKALEVGLVDKIGGLSDAIEYARKKAALPLWAPIAYSHGGDELQRWIKDLQDKGAIKSAHQIGARYFQNKLFGSSFETHHELKQFIHQIQDYSSLFSGPQMRLPFLILKE
jgi:protease-4